MLDLAISIDADSHGTAIVETNHGEEFKAHDWPRDCDFQMVAYRPSGKSCKVVSAGEVVEDIAHAIRALKAVGAFRTGTPDWARRLTLYAAGASSFNSGQ